MFKFGHLFLLIIPHGFIPLVNASVGDRSSPFQNCLRECRENTCIGQALHSFKSKQPFYLRYMAWSCEDECGYNCMWMTVDLFSDNDYDCPQFYGKWPFIRLLGIQEPASTLFSLLNALTQIIGAGYVISRVSVAAPMFIMWMCYYMVCIHAWFWSIVYHSRDFPFTELMDYSGAFSLVLFSSFISVVRVFIVGDKKKIGAVGLLYLSFYVRHIYYLAYIKFDYGYNMQVNISVGISNLVCWLLWCRTHYYQHRQTYQWRCALSVLLTSALLLLEVADFPPLLWTFDAHSLWHLSTVPIHLLFARFVVDDCRWLQEQQLTKKLP